MQSIPSTSVAVLRKSWPAFEVHHMIVLPKLVRILPYWYLPLPSDSLTSRLLHTVLQLQVSFSRKPSDLLIPLRRTRIFVAIARMFRSYLAPRIRTLESWRV